MKNRKHTRKTGFDYASEAIYFLTICTHNRIGYFGDIVNKTMYYNDYGLIVQQQIDWLIHQYPYFLIHNYVVMPNHVHILAEISNVGTGRDLSLRTDDIRIKSISELIGAFKTRSSKFIHLAGNTEFCWQRSFHDHIVHNENSYNLINLYITQNPEKWHNDSLNSHAITCL